MKPRYLGFQRLLAKTGSHCLNHATWFKQCKTLIGTGQRVHGGHDDHANDDDHDDDKQYV